MKTILCIWLLIGGSWCMAQGGEIGQKLKLLASSQGDRAEVDLRIEIADAYLAQYELDEALTAFRNAYTLADRIHYPQGNIDALLGQARYAYFADSLELGKSLVKRAMQVAMDNDLKNARAHCLIDMGNFQLLSPDQQAARNSFRDAYFLFLQEKETLKMAVALGGIADTYLHEGQYFEALDTLLLSFRIAERARDTFLMARVTYSISGVYKNIPGYKDQAIKYTRQSVVLSERSGNEGLFCLCTSNLGQVYADLNETDSARKYLLRATEICASLNGGKYLTTAYLALSSIEKQQGNFQKAWDLLQLALQTETPAASGLYDRMGQEVLIQIGNCAISLHQYRDAEKYLSWALQSYTVMPDPGLGVDLYEGLGDLAEIQQRPAEALRYFRLSVALRDSLYNEENTRRTAEVAISHDFERKQAIAEAEKERELTLRDARNMRQTGLFGGLLLVIIAGGAGLFFFYRKQQEQRRTLLELANLRAQMNPHFIFNCLNSIYRYIKERDTDTAGHYLQKFSRLLRLVLENSRTEKITLAKDLEALELYVEIEALRFKDKLRFHLDVSPEIDRGFVQVPGMLMQPHVENAIWHGLMPKEAGGEIWVTLTQPEERLLRVEIADNGVGRAFHEAANEVQGSHSHKSLGTIITEARIKSTGKVNRGSAQTQIIDQYDAELQATGTLVRIEIPI